MNKPKTSKLDTSWQPVEKWYKKIVGEEGHYYHQKIIIPSILRIFDLKSTEQPNILDLACGQGVLARHLGKNVDYTGLDIAPSFIKEAKKSDQSPHHHYLVADVTKPLPLKGKKFTHAAIVLALQNIEQPDLVFKNAHQHLEKGGQFTIILNHPCFRIPRQSSWGIDDAKKLQYRRIDRYFTEMKIPLQAHPSQGESSASTISFHHPISTYTRWLKEAGFLIENIEEWCSDKVSTGPAAKMENRSREEFPLFFTIICRA